jgi:putative FmdB family regulatory protein
VPNHSICRYPFAVYGGCELPLYDYSCENCNEDFEKVLSVAECDDPQRCPECGGPAKKIFCVGHGGVQREDPAWVKGVGQALEAPITTIKELRQFYRDNPNIRPKESHPALASSIGDVSKPDMAQMRKDRRKKAYEHLRKNRAITISSAG